MGVAGREGWEDSYSRILAVDSNPSITGIWISINTTSNEFYLKDSKAWSPFSTAVMSWPRFFNNFVAKARFTAVSSASKILREGPGSIFFSFGLEFPLSDSFMPPIMPIGNGIVKLNYLKIMLFTTPSRHQRPGLQLGLGFRLD